MKVRLFPALLLAVACARGGFVLYQDPDQLFSAEVPGVWRVLDGDGVRRVTFAGGGKEPSGASISVLFYPAASPQGRDPDAFASSHRLGARALGPVEHATLAGAQALRYAEALDARGGAIRESAAIVKTEKGLYVILYDDREGAGPDGAAAFERLLATLRF
jgi:hypothetical protein